MASVVFLLAVTSTAAAAPAGFTAAPRLEPAASFVAGKHVTVWCARSLGEWRQYVAGRSESDILGLTVPGSSEIRVAPVVCTNLRAKLNGQVVGNDGFAPSLLLLVHEAVHARGSADEGKTDCAATHETPRVAVKFFRVKAGKQLRAVMAAVWTWRTTSPPAYRTVC